MQLRALPRGDIWTVTVSEDVVADEDHVCLLQSRFYQQVSDAILVVMFYFM